MNKLLMLLLLVSNFLIAADSLKITYTDRALEDFNIAYFHDDTNSLSIDQVLSSDFQNTENQSSFGADHRVTWYKLILSNTTSLDKNIYLHSNLAYMSREISIFEFKDNNPIDQNKYDMFDSEISNKLSGSTLVYPVFLPQNSTKTIFIKNNALVHQLIDLSIYDRHHSIQVLINKNFYSNIIVAALFSLAIYNLMLFFFSRRKEFAYYSLYLMNASLGLFYMYGSLSNNLNIHGSFAYQFNITAILVSLFLILFIKSIFDTYKVNKNLNTYLNSVMFFVLLNLAIAIFIDLSIAMQIVAVIFLYTFFILVYTGLYFYKKKHPLAKIFLLAYFAYILGMGITIASFEGYIPYSFFGLHASGIGLIFEALLFSYILNFRIKLLEKEIVRHQNSLIIKNKKAQLGDMIGAITHQWKQPLTAISSVSTALQYRLDKESNISSEYLKPKLQQIEEKIYFLVETINDFRSFFNPKRVHEECDAAIIIERAVSLSQDDMLADEIMIKTDLNFKNKVYVYPNELLHIILNLMQNSKEAFASKEIQVKIIKIIGSSEGEKTIIDLIDNAGGIPENDLDKIFTESYTTKENKDGSGLGLYLTRFILKEHMNGSIEVEKIENGTMFRIIL